MTDRDIMKLALDALDGLYLPGELDRVNAAITALHERLAHCDRCGKKLGGEGDIHTCTPKTNQCGETCERAKMCATCAGVLAQPEQEPVAWLCGRSNGDTFSLTVKQLHELGYGNISIKPFNKLAPLFTTLPTDQEPYGWVQPNPGFNSGIFNQGAACPYGWVGSAIAVYTAQPQPEQPNDFKPDWDAMAVMVEEQQRMAKRIEELEAQQELVVAHQFRKPYTVDWYDPYKTRTQEPVKFAFKENNDSAEVLRVTPEGEFIWHPDADKLLAEGDFSQSPALPHILKALRKQRTWVGLTNADWKHLYDEFAMGQELDEFAEAIEAKLKERNT